VGDLALADRVLQHPYHHPGMVDGPRKIHALVPLVNPLEELVQR
jgi:hypothetical protein